MEPETTRSFRQATPADAGRIWAIILGAKERMRLRGSTQWQTGYPARTDILRDIERGEGWVLCAGEAIAAYGAVVFDGEPAYRTIEGVWPDEAPYVVVHRLAVAGEMAGRGMASTFMQQAAELARRRGVQRFRVDTNYDNLPMQHILETLGFSYCGEIYYEGAARRAYHKKI